MLLKLLNSLSGWNISCVVCVLYIHETCQWNTTTATDRHFILFHFVYLRVCRVLVLSLATVCFVEWKIKDKLNTLWRCGKVRWWGEVRCVCRMVESLSHSLLSVCDYVVLLFFFCIAAVAINHQRWDIFVSVLFSRLFFEFIRCGEGYGGCCLLPFAFVYCFILS